MGIKTDATRTYNTHTPETEQMNGSALPYVADRQRFAETVAGLSTMKVKDGDGVVLLGYDAARDGGGQALQYDASSTAAINGGSVFPGLGGSLSFNGLAFDGTAGTGRFIAADQTVMTYKQFGGKTYAQDNTHDASATLYRLLDSAGDAGASVVIEPTNESYLDLKNERTLFLSNSVSIKASGVEIRRSNAQTIAFTIAAFRRHANVSAITNANRNGTTIEVSDATGIVEGDLIRISSNVAFETTYNYAKSEVHSVAAISGTTITLTEPLVFTYSTNGSPTNDTITVAVYKRVGVSIEGPLILSAPSGLAAGSTLLNLSSLTGPVVQNVKMVAGDKSVDMIRISGCRSPKVSKVEIDGGRYPIYVASGSRNGLFEQIDSRDCFHPIDFNNAAITHTVRDLIGYNNDATVNSHPAFDIHYENVICREGRGANLRSVGGSIKNFEFTTNQQTTQTYFQDVVFNTAESTIENIYPFTDFYAENIFAENKQSDNYFGLNMGPEQRNCIYRNCTVARIEASFTNQARVLVADCKVNRVNVRGLLSRISNTECLADYPHSKASTNLSSRALNIAMPATGKCIFVGGLIDGYDAVWFAQGPQFDTLQLQNSVLQDISVDLFFAGSSSSAADYLDITGTMFIGCTLPYTTANTHTLTVKGNVARGGTVNSLLTA